LSNDLPPAAGFGHACGLNRSSLAVAYALVGVSALALALIDLALVLDADSPWPTWLLVSLPIFPSLYVVAGALAALRRPAGRMGALMVVAGLVWLLAELSNSAVPALIAAGLILATVPLAVIYHLLLAFPSGHLRGRISLVTVLLGYFVCTVMQAPQYLFGGGSEGPYTVLQVADRPDLADAGLWAQWALGSCATIAVAIILWTRWRRVAPSGRRAVAPLLAYGIAAVLWVPISGRLFHGFGVPDDWAPWVAFSQMVVIGIVPVAFGATILGGGFGRTLAVDELAARIGPEAERTMAAALAEALGDPTVELALWMPDRKEHVDGLGSVVAVPPLGPERGAVEVIGGGGERLGAILYDATLIADRSLVEAVARVAGLELDRERMAGELRLAAVAARDDERRRLARDLHDGMQTRLLLLAMSANELREEAQLSADDRERLGRLESGLASAVEELRTFAHGFLPATLVERGIYAAAEDLACAYPGIVDPQIQAGAERPPVPVETTAYFVVSEALANSLKHAGADSVRLSLARHNGSLLIEVEDNGRGGASPAGSGIGGIRDRVEALDGTLALTSPAWGGTLLRVELPCG
jgi:signal transduction histidine kinase